MRYDNHPGHEDIMGNRLSKIYTRTGDAGTTGLGDGKRVSKNSLRIHALGEVDETNAIIGCCCARSCRGRARAADQRAARPLRPRR